MAQPTQVPGRRDELPALKVRTRGTYPPKPVIARLGRFVIGPADFVMVSGQMLRGIKRRAERAAKTSPQPAA